MHFRKSSLAAAGRRDQNVHEWMGWAAGRAVHRGAGHEAPKLDGCEVRTQHLMVVGQQNRGPGVDPTPLHFCPDCEMGTPRRTRQSTWWLWWGQPECEVPLRHPGGPGAASGLVFSSSPYQPSFSSSQNHPDQSAATLQPPYGQLRGHQVPEPGTHAE